jgi:HSP20 family molecular chaperone IbpA
LCYAIGIAREEWRVSSPPHVDEELQEITEKLVARRREFSRDVRALSREFEQEMEVLRSRIGARDLNLGGEADGLIIEADDHLLYMLLIPQLATQDVKVSVKRNLRKGGRRELRISCLRESADEATTDQGSNRQKGVTRLELRRDLPNEFDPKSMQVGFEGTALQVRIARSPKP